ARNVVVEVRQQDTLLPRGSAALAVGPRQTARVNFPTAPPPTGKEKEMPLPEVLGPLQLAILDKDNNLEVLAKREMNVSLASPREYVRVPSISFQPTTPKSKNRLEVVVKAAVALTGPPCQVDLVLPPDRIPGLKVAREGKFGAVLPSGGAEVKL